MIYDNEAKWTDNHIINIQDNETIRMVNSKTLLRKLKSIKNT